MIKFVFWKFNFHYMKKLAYLAIGVALVSCNPEIKRPLPPQEQEFSAVKAAAQKNSEPAKEEVKTLLDLWHAAAGKADFEGYFGLMAENSIYMGTDATENWDLEEFKEFSRPYFDRGRAWDFSPIARNIYFSDSGETAWFDELLDTHMGICRGSGVLSFQDGEWKIVHYVLSMTVPNEQADEVTELKGKSDSSLVQKSVFRGSIK